MARATGALVVLLTAIAASAMLAEPESPDLTRINQKFLISVDDVQKLHAAKDAMAPARWT
jgi:hypothetical protein